MPGGLGLESATELIMAITLGDWMRDECIELDRARGLFFTQEWSSRCRYLSYERLFEGYLCPKGLCSCIGCNDSVVEMVGVVLVLVSVGAGASRWNVFDEAWRILRWLYL